MPRFIVDFKAVDGKLSSTHEFDSYESLLSRLGDLRNMDWEEEYEAFQVTIIHSPVQLRSV